MLVISELAEKLANRLKTYCPKCQTPGWGETGIKKGLECAGCGLKTALISAVIFGCTKCYYQELMPPSHGLSKSDPGNCAYCNP